MCALFPIWRNRTLFRRRNDSLILRAYEQRHDDSQDMDLIIKCYGWLNISSPTLQSTPLLHHHTDCTIHFCSQQCTRAQAHIIRAALQERSVWKYFYHHDFVLVPDSLDWGFFFLVMWDSQEPISWPQESITTFPRRSAIKNLQFPNIIPDVCLFVTYKDDPTTFEGRISFFLSHYRVKIRIFKSG